MTNGGEDSEEIVNYDDFDKEEQSTIDKFFENYLSKYVSRFRWVIIGLTLAWLGACFYCDA